MDASAKKEWREERTGKTQAKNNNSRFHKDDITTWGNN
jgi:hypothetical protein